jgi:hypothetical protein
MRHISTLKPLFNDGAPRPNCVQEGCTHNATHFAVYGCMDSHTYEGYYCLPCLLSKRDHVKMNHKFTYKTFPSNTVIWACQNTDPIMDLAFVALNDPFRGIHDVNGERIFD